MRSRSLLVAAALAFLLAPFEASADRVYGAYIPDDTRKIGEGQYVATRDWDKTINNLAGVYYRKNTCVWRQMETAPGIRGVYIHNLAKNDRWEGINVYEADGKVYLTVLPNAAYTPAKKKSRKRKK